MKIENLKQGLRDILDLHDDLAEEKERMKAQHQETVTKLEKDVDNYWNLYRDSGLKIQWYETKIQAQEREIDELSKQITELKGWNSAEEHEVQKYNEEAISS